MDLKSYFETTTGIGILATADSEGRVNAAIYARPHVQEDGSLVFIMNNRLTYYNLQSNPHAAYLFCEEGPGYKGKRLYMTKLREEDDPERIQELSRRDAPEDTSGGKPKYLVYFRLDKEIPLVGGKKTTLAPEPTA